MKQIAPKTGLHACELGFPIGVDNELSRMGRLLSTGTLSRRCLNLRLVKTRCFEPPRFNRYQVVTSRTSRPTMAALIKRLGIINESSVRLLENHSDLDALKLLYANER